MAEYEITTRGTGQQNHRITVDGQLQRNDKGRVVIYTQTGAEKALAKLERAQLEELEAGSPALEAQQAAVLGVLNTSKRRLDGLTHEEAAARFGAPPPILCVVSTRRQIVLIQGRTRGTYTLDKLGQVVAVEIAELDGGVIYNGTLAGLEAGGTKTKYAVKLAPWRRIGMVALARHTPPQGVAG